MTASTRCGGSNASGCRRGQFLVRPASVVERTAFLDGGLPCRAEGMSKERTRGLFDLSLPSAREFRQYDVRSARLGDTLFSLVKVDSVSGYDIEMMHDPDLILLHILMRGSAQLQQGSTKVDAAPAQMVLLEGMARSHKRWHGSTQLLMVRLSRSRMERIVASETGISIGDPLNFGVLQVLDLERVSTLWNYIVTICRDLNDPHPCFDGHVGRLAERTLLLLLLNAVPNNYKWAFADDSLCSAAPYYVRRVENYIREHAREPDQRRRPRDGGRRERPVDLPRLPPVPIDHADGLSQGGAPRPGARRSRQGRRQGPNSVTRGRHRGRLHQPQPVLPRLQGALPRIAVANPGRRLTGLHEGPRRRKDRLTAEWRADWEY